MKKRFLFYLLPLFILLQSCSSTGNGISTYYNDSNISYAIIQKMKQHPNLYNKNHIVPTVYQGTVLLAGQALNSSQRIKAQQIVQSIPGVKHIYNELSIAGPSTTLTRSSDAWITSKVTTEMLFNKNLQSSKIKVVTENGVVYLMGTISQRQVLLAENIARRVRGVQQVVALFHVV